MNLSQLEILAAIVDAGSLTEAAEQIGLTQSAVSHSLNKLEAELGVILLERGRQGVTVTRIGEEVLIHTRQILAQLEIIRQKTARERGISVGRLRFGCVPNFTPRLLMGILRDFQHQYPDIEIALFEGNPQEILEWLSGGIVDVATVLTPENHRLTVPLAQDEIRVLVSVKHPLAQRDTVSFGDIADQPLIGPRATFGMVTSLPQMRGVVPPRLRYEVSAYSTIYAMVRENMGIALTPARLIDNEGDGIVQLALLPRIAVQVYLAAELQSPAIQVFMKHAQQWALEHGYLNL